MASGLTEDTKLHPAPGPIGVFDSGLGGLSVLSAFEARLPDQAFVYLGDNANAPYGDRPADEIKASKPTCCPMSTFPSMAP